MAMDWYRLLEVTGTLLATHTLLWEYTQVYRLWWRALVSWLRGVRRAPVSRRLYADVSDALAAGGW